MLEVCHPGSAFVAAFVYVSGRMRCKGRIPGARVLPGWRCGDMGGRCVMPPRVRTAWSGIRFDIRDQTVPLRWHTGALAICLGRPESLPPAVDHFRACRNKRIASNRSKMTFDGPVRLRRLYRRCLTGLVNYRCVVCSLGARSHLEGRHRCLALSEGKRREGCAGEIQCDSSGALRHRCVV